MTRSFKVSFPLPGRRPTNSPGTTPGSQISARKEGDGSPLCHPGAKAEKVLGALDGDGSELYKKTKKEYKSLRRYPSFMSVTLSDMDAESVQAEDGFPFPGVRTPSEVIRRTTQAISRHGSSPLLGEHLSTGSATDYFSCASRPPPHHADSSSTLRSHYEKTKSTLLVSQQTSSSSVRDMALRKGLPTVSSPLNHDVVREMKTMETKKIHTRNLSDDSKLSGNSKVSANSKIAGMPRRRPSVNDPPTLYPNAPRAFHAVSPPSALINSAVPKEEHPGILHSKSFHRPRWWDRKKSKTPPSPPRVEHIVDPPPIERNYSSVKIHVKKPKAGARNWFDGLDDDENMPELLHQVDGLKRPFPQPPSGPLSISEIMSQQHLTPAPPVMSSFGHKSQPSGSSDPRSNNSVISPALTRIHGELSPQPSVVGSLPGSPSVRSLQSTESSRGIHPGIDLQIQSVLNLSSSDDEDDSSALAETSHRRHRIRASIEKADYGSEVLLGNAQRVQPARPRPAVNRNSRGPSSRSSQMSEIVPPVPRIPNRPQLAARTSSMKWKEIMEERSTSTTTDAGESTYESGESSLNLKAEARDPVSRSKKNKNLRGSKLMKVTTEEERLLEAMREKRASVRSNDFQKGFKKAMQLQTQDLSPRPQTAGADGRTSRSSLYRSRALVSPPPSQQQNKSSLSSVAGSRLSMSTDNILEDGYPFPHVSSVKKPPNISPPKPSPSLSLSHSDRTMSTPTSHNSPMTPPPNLGALSIYGRSPFRGAMPTNKYGHERTRTASSGIVMVAGTEHHDNEVGEWEMDNFWSCA